MNDYRETFTELRERNSFTGEQWFGERKRLVDRYGWAVPNEMALDYCANFDDIVSVGSGKAYWESLLQDRGVSVECYDADPPDDAFMSVEESYVLDLDRDTIRNNTVFLSWPPYGKPMATEVLHEKPAHVLYVGEWRGCCAKESFFDTLETEYGKLAEVTIPSYEGVHDNLYHYARIR